MLGGSDIAFVGILPTTGMRTGLGLLQDVLRRHARRVGRVIARHWPLRRRRRPSCSSSYSLEHCLHRLWWCLRKRLSR